MSRQVVPNGTKVKMTAGYFAALVDTTGTVRKYVPGRAHPYEVYCDRLGYTLPLGLHEFVVCTNTEED